jgi:hypothetical protein
MGRKAKQTPIKSCEHCGYQFERKRINGRLEDLSVFHRRRYCSLICANSKSENLTKGAYHWRARRMRKCECEACGGKANLQAHHVDQDHTNNTPKNVQTLCKPCHDFWHSTQKRLGLPIAGRMPSLHLTGRAALPE